MGVPFHILVVDDRESNRLTLRALLARVPDCEVLEAASGEEALLQAMQHELQLIMLDVNMPGMDGFETARHLQSVERTRHIPVIFLTAVSKAAEFVERGYGLGAVDYLSKPIDDNLLINRVRLYKRLFESHLSLQAANLSLQGTMAQLREAQQRLLHTEKLSALIPMVAAVAHELNTPIGNCRLMVSALREENIEFHHRWHGPTPMRRSELESFLRSNAAAIDVLSRGLERAADVISRFKEVSVHDSVWARARFDLTEPVRLALKRARENLLPAGCDVELDVPAGMQMESYPGPITQVIDELLMNSVLHGYAGRTPGPMRLSARQEGARVLLHYSDEGLGMPQEILSKIFDPFFTTRFGQGSSGLGLSICYNLIIGLLGGSIDVRSELGQGCQFTISLPCVAPESQAERSRSL